MTIVDGRVQAIGPIFADAVPYAASAAQAPTRDWTWINWSLSLLIAPAAVVTMALALDKGAAACHGYVCGGVAAREATVNLLHHAAAGVAALTLFFAFFFATRRCGIAVWALGWTLLGIDAALLLTV